MRLTNPWDMTRQGTGNPHEDMIPDEGPWCEDCGESGRRLTDYYAGTPSPEALMLCDSCFDAKCEQAQESADADYYGGDFVTLDEQMAEARKAKG